MCRLHIKVPLLAVLCRVPSTIMATTWKLPLMKADLITVTNAYKVNPSHNDILFITQLLTGFNCLLCLGELTWPDKLDLCNYRKVSMWHSVDLHASLLSFWSPGHKADQYFEGNDLIIRKHNFSNTYFLFMQYLASCDVCFQAWPELWLCANGTIPTHAWFIGHLWLFFPSSIASQSMQVGGATSLAEMGIAPNLIQVAGRWTSETFNHYVQKNYFLFEGLLIGWSSLLLPMVIQLSCLYGLNNHTTNTTVLRVL